MTTDGCQFSFQPGLFDVAGPADALPQGQAGAQAPEPEGGGCDEETKGVRPGRKAYVRQRPQVSFYLDEDGVVVPLSSHGSGLTAAVWIKAVLSAPTTWAVAAAMPDPRRRSGPGVRTMFPPVVVLLLEALANMTGGLTPAAVAVCENWGLVCDLMAAHGGEDVQWLRGQRPSRRVAEAYCKKHLDAGLVEQLVDVHTAEAVRLAVAEGSFAAGRHDWLRPCLEDLVVGDATLLRVASTAHPKEKVLPDGRVIEVMMNSQATERDKARIIPEVRMSYRSGDGRVGDGRLHQAFHALLPGGRILALSVQYLRVGGRTEAEGARRAMASINAALGDLEQDAGPLGRARCLVYDGALKGECHTALAADGVMVVNRVDHSDHDELADATGVKSAKEEWFRSVDLGAHDHMVGGDLCSHRLAASGSRVGEVRFADGEARFVPLELVKVEHVTGDDGVGRFDLTVEVPCPRQKRPERKVLPSDLRVGGRLITQAVRVLPVDSPTFTETYPARSAAESWFAWLKRKLPHQRSRHDDPVPESFGMLAAAVLNAAQVHFLRDHAG